jgi:hypothetical protein
MKTSKILIAISILIGVLGYNAEAGSIDFWKWTHNYTCAPGLPTAPCNDSSKCSGFTDCSIAYNANCPECPLWEWLDWVCSCPSDYTSPTATYQMVWKKTAESSTTTITVEVGVAAPPKTVSGPVPVTVNGKAMWQYVVTVDYGICDIVAM